jgi:hypothetical protein
MVIKISRNLAIGLVMAVLAVGGFAVAMSSHSAFAHNVCIGQFACSAIGGDGGLGGDTGDATSGDIGPGGSCFAISSTIGDECDGITGSSEPVAAAVITVLTGVGEERLPLTYVVS